MADIYSQIVQELVKQRKSIEDENPWVTAGTNATKTPIEYDNRNNQKDVIGASIIQNVLGGLMRGYGKGQANREEQEFDTEYATAQQSESPIVAMQNSQNPKIRALVPLFSHLDFANKEKRIQKKLDLQDKFESKMMGDYGLARDGESLDFVPMGNLPDLQNEVLEGREEAKARARAKYPRASYSQDMAQISQEAQDPIIDELMGQGMSEEKARGLVKDPAGRKLYSSLRNLGYRGDAIEQAGDRLALQSQKFAFDKSKYDLPNYADLSGTPLSPGTKATMEKKIAATANIINRLEKIEKIGDEAGYNKLFGSGAREMEAYVKSLTNMYRDYTGSGANLTQPEINLIEAVIPRIASGGVRGALKDLVLGRNQKTFISAMKKLAGQDVDYSLYALGKGRIGVDNEKYYPPELRARYFWGSKAGIIGETQPSSEIGGAGLAGKGQSVPQFPKDQKIGGVSYRTAGGKRVVQTGEDQFELVNPDSLRRAKAWAKRK